MAEFNLIVPSFLLDYRSVTLYQEWLNLGNEGTMADFIAWLRTPATEAAAQALQATAEALAAAQTLGQGIAAAEAAATLANTKAVLANDAALLANEKAALVDSAATLANTKAGLADAAAILATDKAGLADSKATLANDKAVLAQSAADNANAKAAEVTAAVLSAGELGSIKPTDPAPTPARNGNYTFSIGGNKPAWLTAEPLVTTVKAGDGVAVVYVEPSSYSYTHVDVGNVIYADNFSVNLRKSLFETMGSSQIGTAYNTAGYYSINGQVITGFNRITPLFKIAPGQKVDYTLLGESGALSVIAAFDKDFNYISANSLIGTGATQTGTWTAGATTCFVAFCANNDSSMTISGLGNNSITSAKLSANLNKLLFEIMDSSQIGSAYNTTGYYNFSNGSITPGYGVHTPLFKVVKGQKIGYTLKNNSTIVALIVAFDKNFNYISANSLQSTSVAQTGIWTAGETTCYVSFCSDSNASMLLTPFLVTSNSLSVNLNKSLFEIMDSSQIGNAYNVTGYYNINGTVNDNPYNRRTPLFKVVKGQKIDYTLSGVTGIALIVAFDKDFKYILENSLLGNGATQKGTWTAGETTCFVGFCATTDAQMIIDSTKRIKETDIILPATVPVCLGLELNIYNNSLRAIPDYRENYTRVRMTATTAQQAMQKVDRLNFFHSTVIGDYPATAYQETLTGTILDTKAFTIKCIDKKILLSKSRINILPIGDSIMEMGYYMRAIQDNFKIAQTAGGTNIRFIGNRPHNPQPDINGFGNIYDEGRSGWATPHFVTNGLHVGGSFDGDNPLWNATYPGGADIDFVNYINNLNLAARYVSDPIDTIDAFMVVLGTNDPAYCTLSQYIDNINTLISKLWRDFPNAIVLISSIPPMGLDSTSKATRINWNAGLISQFEANTLTSSGSGRAYYCPGWYSINREIGYNVTGKSRMTGEYTYQGDGYDYNLHPTIVGGQQFGDALFSAIQYALQRHKDYLDSIV